jgi:hypothetical protein
VRKDIRCTDFPERRSSPAERCVTQALSCHRASSVDIASWAPPRDKSVKLFSRASVPPAIVSKDDRERNLVLPRSSTASTYTMAPSSDIVVPFHFTSGIPHPSFKTGSAPSRRGAAFGMTNHFTRHEHEEGPCVRIIKTRKHQT